MGGETEAYGYLSVLIKMLNQTGIMWVRGIRGLGKGWWDQKIQATKWPPREGEPAKQEERPFSIPSKHGSPGLSCSCERCVQGQARELGEDNGHPFFACSTRKVALRGLQGSPSTSGLCDADPASGIAFPIRLEKGFLHFPLSQGSPPLMLVWGFCSEAALSLHPHLLPLSRAVWVELEQEEGSTFVRIKTKAACQKDKQKKGWVRGVENPRS